MKLLPVFNAICFIAVIAANWAANALPLNGNNTGELSALYPNYFVPAGYAFSIWGLICLLALGYVFYGFVGERISDKEAVTSSMVDKIGWKWGLVCALNVGWIFAWHYRFLEVSVVVMLAYLATLSFIFLDLRENNRFAPSSSKEAWMVWLPFGVHLGWICVATVANVTAWLVDLDISFGARTDVIITMAVISIVMFLAVYFIRYWGSGEVAAVVAWALFAISVRHWEDENSLAIVALAAAALIVLRIFSSWKSLWFGKQLTKAEQ